MASRILIAQAAIAPSAQVEAVADLRIGKPAEALACGCLRKRCPAPALDVLGVCPYALGVFAALR